MANAKFWKDKTFKDAIKAGRPRVFKTPYELWEAAEKYFDFIENTKLNEEQVFAYKGEITRTTVDRQRVMTHKGLCAYNSLPFTTYCEYKHREEFAYVCAMIDQIIENQQITGAASGIFKENLISRMAGLKDKTDISSEDGSMTPKESKTVIVTSGDVKSVLDMI